MVAALPADVAPQHDPAVGGPLAGAPPRIVFVGCVAEGRRSLEALLALGENVVAVFTLTPAAAARVSGAVSWADLTDAHGIPLEEVPTMNDPRALAALRGYRPDLVFCVGWTQLLSRDVLAVPPLGTIGFHASLLPRYRGRAPVNWALINGEEQTGNTMLLLDAGVDTGDILAQRAFPITGTDTCASLYDKVAESEVDMIAEVLPQIRAGRMPRTPQDHSRATVMPRRRPEDGRIDWRRSARDLDRWVRALTHPYPGAFTEVDRARVFVWEAAPGPAVADPGPPGSWRLYGDAPELLAWTGEGTLALRRLQREGDVERSGPDFAARWLPAGQAVAS